MLKTYNPSIIPAKHRLREGDKFAVYGTLRKGCGNYENLGLDTRAKLVGSHTVQGVLFGLHGGFPGLVEEHPDVDMDSIKPITVEVYEIVDPTLGSSLDSLEGYRLSDTSRSLYIRSEILVEALEEAVAIYYYNYEPPLSSLIEEGDWLSR